MSSTVHKTEAILKFFDLSKGFGFASLRDENKDVFLHITKFAEVVKTGRYETLEFSIPSEARQKNLFSEGAPVILFGTANNERGDFATKWTTPECMSFSNLYVVLRKKVTKTIDEPRVDNKKKMYRVEEHTVIEWIPVFAGDKESTEQFSEGYNHEHRVFAMQHQDGVLYPVSLP